MLEAMFALGDKIERFGNAYHGLALNPFYGERLLRVNGQDFPMPFEWNWNTGESIEFFDVHLLRVPGLPEVDISPEEAAAEAAQGRTWQNWALLSTSNLALMGKQLMGWVCIDTAGNRWLIKTNPGFFYGDISASAPLTLQVSAVPFGYLDETPVEPFVQSVTLADIGQATGEAPPTAGTTDALQLVICSISSDGRRVIIEVRGRKSPAIPQTLRDSSAPAGFLLLELSGPGPQFALTLSVLKSRVQCLGDYEEQLKVPPGSTQAIKWATTSTPRTVGGVAGKDYICNAGGIEPKTSQDYGPPYMGSGWVGWKRKNRLVALVFDETDTIVELAYTAEFFVEYDFPAFSGEVEGAVSGWLADSSNYTNSNVTNTVVGHFSRESTETVRGQVALLRDGVEIGRDGLEFVQPINESFDLSPSFSGQTPDLTRKDGNVDGGGNRFMHAYNYHASMTCAEVTWPVITFSSGPGFIYNNPLFSKFTGSSTNKPFTYLVQIEYGNTLENDYAGGSVTFKRPSNCLLGVTEQARKGVKPARNLTRRLVGPRSTWLNPAEGADTDAVRGSYHPLTHEIHASAQAGGSAAFCWI
ncbi:hypothetical protein BWR15_06225 [Pseudomonas sp. T]|nr:hypothetical protein BWR15_06225 [Pseudomonas sp. T]